MRDRTLPNIPIGLLVLAVAACGGDGAPVEDPRCAELSQQQLDEVSDSLQPMIELLQNGAVTSAGVTADLDEEAMRASLSFDGYQGEKSGAVYSGQLDLENDIQGYRADLTVVGGLEIADGTTGRIEMDFRLRLPWDPEEGDFAGPPTDVDGTISLDEASCAAERFPDLNPEPEEDPEPHFLVAGMQGAIPYSADGSTWDNAYDMDETGLEEDLFGIACDSQGECAAVGAGGHVVHGQPDGTWSVVALEQAVALNDVAVCAGEWLAVGEAGAVFTSTDQAQNWSAVQAPAAAALHGAACHGDRFIAVGDAGTIIHGSPASAFSAVADTPAPGPLRAVAGDGQEFWVAVGDDGAVVRSTDDGQSWSSVDMGRSEHLSHVAWGQGRFIAVGQGARGWGQSPLMLRSDDGGTSWTVADLPADFVSQSRPLGALATDGQGRWSAAGNGGDHLLSTDNGQIWSVARLDFYGLYDIAHRP